MPTEIEIEWLDEEKSKARFTVPQPVEWTAQSITELMNILGQARAQMSPAISDDPPILQNVEALTDPRWWSTLDEMSGASLLMFRDPSLGWLKYLLPVHERAKLIAVLTEQERLHGQKQQAH